MADNFQIFPIGIIRKKAKDIFIEVHHRYKDALLGLDQFSHIIVCFWFHKNDSPEKRNTLQVHPRGEKTNPLTGVFATRSPQRPNLIALSTCKILAIDGNIIRIDKIDALNGTPVIDIKPYLLSTDMKSDIKAPGWAKK